MMILGDLELGVAKLASRKFELQVNFNYERMNCMISIRFRIENIFQQKANCNEPKNVLITKIFYCTYGMVYGLGLEMLGRGER